MAWMNSGRKERLPSNWSQLRQQVLKRAEHRCEWIIYWKGSRTRCTERATDVDHRRAGDDHSLANLQALCGKHHARKSAREGGAAYWAKRREVAKRFRREPERHPGKLD